MAKSIKNLLDALENEDISSSYNESRLDRSIPFPRPHTESINQVKPNMINTNQQNQNKPLVIEDMIQETEITPTAKKTDASEVDKILDQIINKNKNNIIVFGVGGGGCNAINRLSSMGTYKDATLIAANTDAIHLRDISSSEKILLGLELTQGLGAGNDPVIGKAAAEESLEIIKESVTDSDMVFVTTGLGGGTGTGAAPIIAKIAKESGALVVGICTLPFEMEGDNRANHSIAGLKELFDNCDTVVIIPNEKLMEFVPELPLSLAFKVADEILIRAVKGIVNLIKTPAYVNVDFADIRQVLKQGGSSVIGMGEGIGENRVDDALRESLSNSLLDIQIMDCKAALINIAGGTSLSLEEVQSCVNTISQEMGEDSEIIWGTHIDPSLGERIQVTTILSGVSSPYNLSFNLIDRDMIEAKIEASSKSTIKSIWD